MEALAEITLAEAVTLSATDGIFYSHFFFPKTVRQRSPSFHKDMWRHLDSDDRLIDFMVFRGGAKTTLVRVFISKRIAFAISRTIIIVGKSQDHARRTVEWLMKQVEFNRTWAETFQLRPGKKWTGEEIEIYHGVDEVPIRVIALGITGSTRGINVDDYRPDLIVIDDPCDEENTATVEQRNKTEDLILGSLFNSLAPKSEAPLAKMVLLQTLLHPEDVISKCNADPAWKSVQISVFNQEGKTAWPDRWSTEELIEQKQSYIDRGKLSLWMREMECKIVSSEMAAFRAPELLQYWTVLPPHEELTTILVCDPVPPPSDREISEGLRGKDYEAWAALGLWQDRSRGIRKIFVLETLTMRGHDPDWSVKTFFEMLDRWHPFKVKVESIAYQRTLKWLLEKAMLRRGRFVMIDAHVPEKRKKSYRIIDGIGAVLSRRELYLHQSQSSLIEAIHSYPVVSHDDEIEAVAVGITELMNYEGGSIREIADAEKAIEDIEYFGGCP